MISNNPLNSSNTIDRYSRDDYIHVQQKLEGKIQSGKRITDLFFITTKSGMDFVEKRSLKGRLYAILHVILRFFGREGYLISNAKIRDIIGSIGAKEAHNPSFQSLIDNLNILSAYIEAEHTKRVDAAKRNKTNTSSTNFSLDLNQITAVLGDPFIKNSRFKEAANSYLPYRNAILTYIKERSLAEEQNWKEIDALLNNIIDLQSYSIEMVEKEISIQLDRSKKCLFVSGGKNHPLLCQIEKQKDGKFSFHIFSLLNDGFSKGLKNISKESIVNRLFLNLLRSLQKVDSVSVDIANRNYEISSINLLIEQLLPSLNGENIEIMPREEWIEEACQMPMYGSCHAFLAHTLKSESYKQFVPQFQLFLLESYRERCKDNISLPLTTENYLEARESYALFDLIIEKYKKTALKELFQEEIERCTAVLQASLQRIVSFDANIRNNMDFYALQQVGYKTAEIRSKTVHNTTIPTCSNLVEGSDLAKKSLIDLEQALRITLSNRERTELLYGEEIKASNHYGQFLDQISYMFRQKTLSCTIQKNGSNRFFLKIDEELLEVDLADEESSPFKGPLSYQYLCFQRGDIQYLYNRLSQKVEFCLEAKGDEPKWTLSEEYSKALEIWKNRRFQTVSNDTPLYIADLSEEQKKDPFIEHLARFEDPNATLFLVDDQQSLREIRFPRCSCTLIYNQNQWKTSQSQQSVLSKNQYYPDLDQSIGALFFEDGSIFISKIDMKPHDGSTLYAQGNPNFEALSTSMNNIDHFFLYVGDGKIEPFDLESPFYFAKRYFEQGNRGLAEMALQCIKKGSAANQSNFSEFQERTIYSILSQEIANKEISWKIELQKEFFEILKESYLKMGLSEITLNYQQVAQIALIFEKKYGEFFKKLDYIRSVIQQKPNEELSEIIHIVQSIYKDKKAPEKSIKRSVPWEQNQGPFKIEDNTAHREYIISRKSGFFPFDPINPRYYSKEKISGIVQYENSLFQECLQEQKKSDPSPQFVQALYSMALFSEDWQVRLIGMNALNIVNRGSVTPMNR
ncbi:MAG: hypothetical protein QRY74_04685 [Chlamydia sp.]